MVRALMLHYVEGRYTDLENVGGRYRSLLFCLVQSGSIDCSVWLDLSLKHWYLVATCPLLSNSNQHVQPAVLHPVAHICMPYYDMLPVQWLGM